MKVLLDDRQKDTASKTSHCCYFSFMQTYCLVLKVRPKTTTRTNSNSPGSSTTHPGPWLSGCWVHSWCSANTNKKKPSRSYTM